MLSDGIEVGESGTAKQGWLLLTTNDPSVAAKYGMVPEEEFWDDADDA